MPATRGPIPKREDVRRRRNAPSDGMPVTTARASANVEPIEGDDNWHPIAQELYESMIASGQSVFYEPSDYATLYLLCDQLSQHYGEVYVGMRDDGRGVQEAVFARRPMTGSDLSNLLKGLASLGATEGDRRRLRIELVRDADGPRELPAGVVAFDRARRRGASAS